MTGRSLADIRDAVHMALGATADAPANDVQNFTVVETNLLNRSHVRTAAEAQLDTLPTQIGAGAGAPRPGGRGCEAGRGGSGTGVPAGAPDSGGGVSAAGGGGLLILPVLTIS